jgi:hypothetical protein
MIQIPTPADSATQPSTRRSCRESSSTSAPATGNRSPTRASCSHSSAPDAVVTRGEPNEIPSQVLGGPFASMLSFESTSRPAVRHHVALAVTDNAGVTGSNSKAFNPISLSARAYKQSGQQKVDLAGAASPEPATTSTETTSRSPPHRPGPTPATSARGRGSTSTESARSGRRPAPTI